MFECSPKGKTISLNRSATAQESFPESSKGKTSSPSFGLAVRQLFILLAQLPRAGWNPQGWRDLKAVDGATGDMVSAGLGRAG